MPVSFQRSVFSIDQIAQLCALLGIGHIVNNAGMHSTNATNSSVIESTLAQSGRITALVEALPYDAAIIAGFGTKIVEAIGQSCQDRAPAAVIDLLQKLLNLGGARFKQIHVYQKEILGYAKDRLGAIAVEFNERLMDTEQREISLAITLATFDAKAGIDAERIRLMLTDPELPFCVDPHLVKSMQSKKEVYGLQFKSYGCHTDSPSFGYLTLGMTLDMNREKVDAFADLLAKMFKKLRPKCAKCGSVHSEQQSIIISQSPATFAEQRGIRLFACATCREQGFNVDWEKHQCHYCSHDCQRADWAVHEKMHELWAKEKLDGLCKMEE